MTVKVAIVVPILVKYDAISTAARNTWRLLGNDAEFQTTLLTAVSEHDDVPAAVVPGVAELLRHPAFLMADIIVYHFGIHHQFFDALLLGNGRARQIVRFHNITPAELLASHMKAVIDKSFAQLHTLAIADEIWADSQDNASVLRRYGVPPERIEVVPLVVDWPPLSRLSDKLPTQIVRIAFIGRAVPSKGLSDLIAALPADNNVELSIVGNMRFGDARYLETCRLAAAKHKAAKIVFLGTTQVAELEQIYRQAHIVVVPSYHEGFCKPAIEALRSGAVPIGYNNSNIPSIMGGFGRIVPTGDVAALGQALRETVHAIRMAGPIVVENGSFTPQSFDAAVERYVRRFSFDGLRRLTRDRLQQVERRKTDVHLSIRSLPDSEMRDRNRSSLNRLIDISDWQPGVPLTDLMRALRVPVGIHRRSWSNAIIILGLSELGIMGPERRGIALDAGSEPLLFYLANSVAGVVALPGGAGHEATEIAAMTINPSLCAPFPFREKHLEVVKHPTTTAAFPDASFNFVLSTAAARRLYPQPLETSALDEIARLLKPGGVAAVIADVGLNVRAGERLQWPALEHAVSACRSLEMVGGAPDLTISASLLENPIDLESTVNVERSPHIVLQRGRTVWTQMSLFLQKTL